MDEGLGVLVAEFGGTEQHDTRLVEGYCRTTIREIGIVLAEYLRRYCGIIAEYAEFLRLSLGVLFLYLPLHRLSEQTPRVEVVKSLRSAVL